MSVLLLGLIMNPFHLAIQVHSIEVAREFYTKVLGCTEGRSDEKWMDFNFYGHQLVCHLNTNLNKEEKIAAVKNTVDGHGVPVPHFGIVLEMDDWQALADKLNNLEVKFEIEPYVRFKGMAGEQSTMFFYDPSGNAIEIKAFRNLDNLFEK